jgi:hypothetical protein
MSPAVALSVNGVVVTLIVAIMSFRLARGSIPLSRIYFKLLLLYRILDEGTNWVFDDLSILLCVNPRTRQGFVHIVGTDRASHEWDPCPCIKSHIPNPLTVS